MQTDKIININKQYWNGHTDLWFGTTSLPEYSVKFVTEDDLLVQLCKQHLGTQIRRPRKVQGY